MIKREEISNPDSCLNRAADDEMIFVLRGHDIASPGAIRDWAARRVAMGKNTIYDGQILHALQDALKMERDQGVVIGPERYKAL